MTFHGIVYIQEKNELQEIFGKGREMTHEQKIAEWSQANKHTLRYLYGEFIGDTYDSWEDFINSDAPTYLEFQDYLFNETTHAVAA